MLNPSETYHRKKQILYDSKNNQILTFRDKMPDGENFTGNLVENINNYIKKFPERIQVVEQETNNQLTLF